MLRFAHTVCLLLLFGSLYVLVSTPGSAQTYPTARWYYEPQFEPPEHQVDMLHMRLEVQFEPHEGLVRGTVTHRFTALRKEVDSLFLNGPRIRVRAASYNGKPARFSTTPEGIIVHLSPPARWDNTDSVTLQYEANPRRGLYFVGWHDTSGESRKQIWSQGQGIDNRHWIPCQDDQNDKLTTETIITFDSRFRVLSNGSLLSETPHPDGTTTWHYGLSHPHSVYLVMLGIGHYAVEERRSKSGVPLHLWYYPEYPDRVEPTYRYSAEAIDFMEQETGVAYPWESYAQIPVQDFLYGGMENTTATVFGDFFLIDRRAFLDRNYISVNVHELAHQWFGNSLTGRAGRNSWLHESFASFYPKLFFRHINGEDAYEWVRKKEHEEALAASGRNRLPILHSQSGRERVYAKGSAVLDMMRFTYGEEAVRRVFTHYLKKHAYGLVESNDLYQAFQDVLGISPWSFFEQWIYRGGEPHYVVSYENISRGGARFTDITVRQEHPRDEMVGLFRMPIVFAVYYADGDMESTRVLIERETQTVTIPNPGNRQISFVLFDPGNWILKTVSFPRSLAELEAQAFRAPHMIDRYDAVVAMRDLAPGRKRTMLTRLYQQEPFYAVRAEVVSQLAKDIHQESRSLVQMALHDRAAEVRLALLNSVTTIPPAERGLFERLLTDSSYEVVAGALRKLVEQFPGESERYFTLTAGVRGVGNQIRILWHELRAGLGNNSSRDSLEYLATPAFEFRTRASTFESLRRLNHLNTNVVFSLCDAMTHPNGRLRGPATDVARSFMAQSACRSLFLRELESGNWTGWQRDILREVIGTQ